MPFWLYVFRKLIRCAALAAGYFTWMSRSENRLWKLPIAKWTPLSKNPCPKLAQYCKTIESVMTPPM